jgi:hypothetical protein
VVSRRNGLRDKWRAAVLVNPDIDGETRAMLLVLHGWMTDNGRVSVPRLRLADMFDVDPRRITERIKRARDAQLLDKVGGGFRGRTSVYDAVIPAGKVAVIPPPFSPNGGGPDAPFIRHLSTDTNRADRTGKVAVGTVPNARVTNVTTKNAPRKERRVLLSELSPWARLAYAPLAAVNR